MFQVIVLASLTGAAGVTTQSQQGSFGRTPSGNISLIPSIGVRARLAANDTVPVRNSGPDVVLFWNEVLLQAVRADRTPPPLAARNMAMVHAAIYDSVNAIARTHRPYYVEAAPRPGASLELSASIATHRILVELYPRQVPFFDAALDDCCADLRDAAVRNDGVLLGQYVAEKILDWRRYDGASVQTAYSSGTAPGLWQPTPPGFRPALLPQWPRLKCFAMKSGSQFRPPAAPGLTSTSYTINFNEVKALGSAWNSARTPEQTEIAWFWADGDGTVTPPGHWNRVAQTVARERRTSPAENARLFAMLNIALADAGIASWDCKFAYSYWRPVQAIRQAGADGNPETIPDPSWTPLLTTPPFPSYTSGHSTFSGAAAAALSTYFGTDDIRFASTSESAPGVTRYFPSFSAAAAEAGRSRIYGGIHWEFDNTEGLACGRDVGLYVGRHFLQPRAPVEPTVSLIAPARQRSVLNTRIRADQSK